ncbi:MAG TPA: molybdopterin-binding protein, partial [Rhizomicrobium sp.]|nr:molybdopterin-binding protein [Rhizomicrobium sp.]
MQFAFIPVAEAEGAILAHGVRAGGKRLRKGRVLSAADIADIVRAGIPTVAVARPDEGDVGEDAAAARIGALAGGGALRVGAAFTGRVNLYAEADGVAVVAPAIVDGLNRIDEAVTLATVAPFARVAKGQMIATVKIIPFAAPSAAVAEAEHMLEANSPAVCIAPFKAHRAALISTFLPDTKSSLLDKNSTAIADRLTALGSKLIFERRIVHATEALSGAIHEAAVSGADPILIFGASAITDRRDVIPAAIVAAGGAIAHFGMPVDPGNLLLLGTLDGRTVIGLPSCARSPKLNGFDFVLWRVLAGLPVAGADLAGMGVGGLLSE